jgi:hypothetical protein
MMKVQFHNKVLYLKNDWSEIDRSDYLFLMNQFALYILKRIDKLQVQMNWLFHIVKIDRPKRRTDTDKYYENLYQIAREFTFLFDADDKPNVNFTKFFITRFRVWFRYHNGAIFEVKNGIPITTITAEQFVDAFSVYSYFNQENKPETLYLLVSILFSSPYDNKKAIQKSATFRYMKSNQMYGVYIQFLALLNYLKKAFPYLFYSNDADKTAGYNLGFAETMYSIVESGYGSAKEVGHMNLIDYLNVLTRKRLEMLRAMKQNKMNAIEIHRDTGIPYELIEQI